MKKLSIILLSSLLFLILYGCDTPKEEKEASIEAQNEKTNNKIKLIYVTKDGQLTQGQEKLYNITESYINEITSPAAGEVGLAFSTAFDYENAEPTNRGFMGAFINRSGKPVKNMEISLTLSNKTTGAKIYDQEKIDFPENKYSVIKNNEAVAFTLPIPSSENDKVTPADYNCEWKTTAGEYVD
ncbi:MULTISPECIES: hypothetical protein [Listeria]|uniref:hypothetical protein n=1 Tax=Listeria TaxID=1637 RepID=UPI000B58FC3A|nr:MULTISPECIES: hypothetical protein [Listeria]